MKRKRSESIFSGLMIIFFSIVGISGCLVYDDGAFNSPLFMIMMVIGLIYGIYRVLENISYSYSLFIHEKIDSAFKKELYSFYLMFALIIAFIVFTGISSHRLLKLSWICLATIIFILSMMKAIRLYHRFHADLMQLELNLSSFIQYYIWKGSIGLCPSKIN